MPVTLGSVVLDGFEVSGALHFGGKQALAVHRLPGGGRIIDALGPDDTDISWSGILTGGQAADRARLLDGLRRGGATVTLAWDSFLVAVVVGELLLEFANPWWIPYAIRCVVSPGTNLAAEVNSTVQSAVLADIGAAAGFTDIGTLASGLAPADAFTERTSDYALASAALSAQISTTDTAIAMVGGELMGSTTIASLLTATGSLANLTAARGYLARANTNFLIGGP